MPKPVACLTARLLLLPRKGCQVSQGEEAIMALIAVVGQLSYLPQDKHRVCN